MLTLKKKKAENGSKKAKKPAPRKNASKAPNTSTVEKMTPSDAPQGETTPEIEAAQTSVAQFEELREQYTGMWSQFQTDYPEAYQLFSAIEEAKSDLQQQVLETKEFIREAKVSIGEFVCTLKYTKPKYNAETMFEIVGKLLNTAGENAQLLSNSIEGAANGDKELEIDETMDQLATVQKMVGMLIELIRSGALKGVQLDQAVMKVLMPRDATLSGTFNDAYDRGGTPLTPSIETPKVS